MIFQDNNVFAHLDLRQNVALGISPSLKLDAAQAKRVDAALAEVGLAALAHRKPGEVSGGERQRVAIARALVRDRPVLLLDEPFAALGPALRRDMLDLVKAMQQARGITVVMVTHQPEDARIRRKPHGLSRERPHPGAAPHGGASRRNGPAGPCRLSGGLEKRPAPIRLDPAPT